MCFADILYCMSIATFALVAGSDTDWSALYILLIVCAVVVFLSICGVIMWKCTSIKKPSSESLTQIAISEKPIENKESELPMETPKENQGRLLSVYEQHLHNRRSSFVMGPQSPHTGSDSVRTRKCLLVSMMEDPLDNQMLVDWFLFCEHVQLATSCSW